MTTVKIGAKVNKIGKQVFYNCKKLQKAPIISKKLTADKVGAKAFTKAESGNYKKLKVKAPSGKLKSYRNILKKKGFQQKRR